jgi:hypothetical protein
MQAEQSSDGEHYPASADSQGAGEAFSSRRGHRGSGHHDEAGARAHQANRCEYAEEGWKSMHVELRL